MQSALLQRKQDKSEPVVRDSQKARAPVTRAPRAPLTLHAHFPALRLGHEFGSSPTSLPKVVQAKLSISEPGDQYEQEADRVAEQVMRMPGPVLRLQRKCGCGGSAASGESCEECASHAPQIQRRATPQSESVTAAPDIVNDVLASPGQALDQSTRDF